MAVMLFSSVHTVRAEVHITAQDIINLMNEWRNSFGYGDLVTDPILMYTAQTTAEYMAQNKLTWHIGDAIARIKAAGYGDGATVFATESFYMGSSSTTLASIKSGWTDISHMYAVNGTYAGNYRNIGAGVAEFDGVIYWVMHAAYIAGGLANPTWDPSVSRTPTTEEYIQPMIVSTPNADGSVTHVVQSGQALWSIAIAYDTRIDDIKALNKLTSDTVYVGQTLVIRLAPSATTTPTITTTPTRPTRTPTALKSPATPAPSKTPGSTPTPTPIIAAMPNLSRQNLGIIIIGICGVGLAAVFLVSFVKNKPKPKKK